MNTISILIIGRTVARIKLHLEGVCFKKYKYIIKNIILNVSSDTRTVFCGHIAKDSNRPIETSRL
jgi:hypothetical protein